MASTLPQNGPVGITEHMAKIRMQLLKKKMDNTRQNQQEDPYGEEREFDGVDPNKIRYHQSMLKRQELLERIKAANTKPREMERPPYAPSPNQHIRQPSRSQSLPKIRRESRQGRPGSYQEAVSPRYGIDDSLEEPLPGEYLQTHAPRKLPEPVQRRHYQPEYGQPYPPSPVWAAPQPVYQPYPHQPYLAPPLMLPAAPISQPQGQKSEYFDMMMLQNAQMHQLFMQQLLVKGLNPATQEPQTVVVEHQMVPQSTAPQPQPQFITVPHNKRPKSKHHHHYSQLPPLKTERPYQINHIQHVETRRSTPSPLPVAAPAPRRPSPVESEPRVYKVKPRPRPAPPPSYPVQKSMPKHPFPGSKALRKLRHIFYAAWFVAFLKIAARKRKENNPSPDDRFLFGIQLKEAIGALHRIYVNPDGNIHPLLQTTISPGADDLTKSFTSDQKALQELVYVIENIIFHMTDVMPQTGVLGTHKKATVFEMIQPGKSYPDGYFWQVENDLMSFDEEGRTTEVDDNQARALLIGMFLTKSLVTTLLMKPLDYGLSIEILDENAEGNLKLISSILIHIVRKVSVPVNSKPLAMPYEITRYLHTDEELKPLLSKMQKTIDYADELLREWTKEYVRRLRAATVGR